MNDLPGVATRQCGGRESNPRPVDCKSGALTTTLPRHTDTFKTTSTGGRIVTSRHGVVDGEHVDGADLKQPLSRQQQRPVIQLEFEFTQQTRRRFGKTLHTVSEHTQHRQAQEPMEAQAELKTGSPGKSTA